MLPNDDEIDKMCESHPFPVRHFEYWLGAKEMKMIADVELHKFDQVIAAAKIVVKNHYETCDYYCSQIRLLEEKIKELDCP